MTQLEDLTAREAEVIRVLKVLGVKTRGFVVIGGYAVNALTSHRFSVDCDLVIARSSIPLLERVLAAEGYRKENAHVSRGLRGGKTLEYVKLVGDRPVSMDLYVDSVVCRQTGGSWTYNLVRENSIEANVAGVTDFTVGRVARRELLMAMKLHSGRDADLRDLVMLSEDSDWDTVAQFANCGSMGKLKGQLESSIETVSSEEFSPALRAEFGLRADVRPLIEKASEGLRRLTTSLS